MKESFEILNNRIQLIVYHYRLLQCSVFENDDELLLIEICLSLLTEQERKFFYKEFIDKEKDWWIDYYSRATYYRHKRRIMEKFLSLYDKTI